MLFRFNSFNIEPLDTRGISPHITSRSKNSNSKFEYSRGLAEHNLTLTFSLETIGNPNSATNDSEIYDRCEPQYKSTLTFLCHLIPAILTHKVIKATSPVQICLAVVV
ncbi:hypothetical protein TNCT_453541 [Trichonephila clavata]|uniref:Uncharacterized protein n=1 Tax=Trichonephila clavata TaxID=2740835 RepID=A0A8X6KFD0_TRICU|nr:hypothetical protein TNCT_453541 [Trichonephila clavata]